MEKKITEYTTLRELLEAGAKVEFSDGYSLRGDSDGKYVYIGAPEFYTLSKWNMAASHGLENALRDLRDARSEDQRHRELQGRPARTIPLEWESAESTQGQGMPLSPNFMWLICRTEDEAYGMVHRDRELFGDDELRWSVKPHKEQHVCASFEEGRCKVEEALGVFPLSEQSKILLLPTD